MRRPTGNASECLNGKGERSSWEENTNNLALQADFVVDFFFLVCGLYELLFCGLSENTDLDEATERAMTWGKRRFTRWPVAVTVDEKRVRRSGGWQTRR